MATNLLIKEALKLILAVGYESKMAKWIAGDRTKAVL
jgi:hypothetical protein